MGSYMKQCSIAAMQALIETDITLTSAKMGQRFCRMMRGLLHLR